MISDWQIVPLGEFLTQRKEFFIIDDFARYKRARVQSHGKGIVLRDEIEGAEIKTKKQQAARTGEFLVAEIDAKVGGFGIVPPELDGAVVSSHYFLFEVNENKCSKDWLDWFVRYNSLEEQVKAQGSTNYAAIRPSHVLNFEIPLPTLNEQRRIVERVKTLAAYATKAKSLREEAVIEIDALTDSILGNLLDENKSNWTYGVMPEFADVNPSRKGQITLKGEDLVSFVPMRAVDDITGTIARAEPRPYQEVSKGYTWFQDGDVIFAKITPCMENGKSAIAKNLINGIAFGSTEFHVLRPSNKVLAEWLYILARSKQFRNDAAAHFKGTAGQQRVPQSFLDNKVIPVPPLDEQRRIVAYLDSVQARLASLRELQSATGEELSALLPSILDNAFKGAL